jgi:hypothetical protein
MSFGIIGLSLGIIATVQSGKVMRLWNAGDTAGAERASRRTETWCLVTTVLVIITSLAIIVFVVIAWRRARS